MEAKYVIGLSLQVSEHRHIQEFGLGATQSKTYKLMVIIYVLSADTNFLNCLAKNLKKGTITYWGLGTDFQALGIVTFQSHLLQSVITVK